jgi:hypothetical protein
MKRSCSCALFCCCPFLCSGNVRKSYARAKFQPYPNPVLLLDSSLRKILCVEINWKQFPEKYSPGKISRSGTNTLERAPKKKFL